MKIYERSAGLLLAVCDADIIGKTFQDGELEVNISTHFYKGDLVDEAEVLASLRAAFSGNFFGKNAVKLAVKVGLVDKDEVKKIAGVPHAQFIRMDI